jgi:sec-independent protein translocase protein TatC
MPERRREEMPFLDHLEELRWRIIWSLAALLIGVGIGFFVVLKFDLIGILQQPIAPYLQGEKLVYTHPSDPFSIVLKTAFVVGVVLALPVILYQIWAFLSPALYRHERSMIIAVLAGGVVLFVGGVALAYFIVLPWTLGFLAGFQASTLAPMITASEYFGFAATMALTFGAVFEIPIVIVALTALGLVRPATLYRWRKFAVIGTFALSAIVTPGDFIGTTVMLAVPLYLLYEMSLAVASVVYRRRQRKIARMNETPSGVPA